GIASRAGRPRPGGRAARHGKRPRRRRAHRDAQRPLPAGRHGRGGRGLAAAAAFLVLVLPGFAFPGDHLSAHRPLGRDTRARHQQRPRLRPEAAPLAGERLAPGAGGRLAGRHRHRPLRRRVRCSLQAFLGRGRVARARLGPARHGRRHRQPAG
ncbi:MAG: Exopolysaccharide biosynthesis protein YbjH, partial [uncultured Acetobacteraceae bacterium]